MIVNFSLKVRHALESIFLPVCPHINEVVKRTGTKIRELAILIRAIPCSVISRARWTYFWIINKMGTHTSRQPTRLADWIRYFNTTPLCHITHRLERRRDRSRIDYSSAIESHLKLEREEPNWINCQRRAFLDIIYNF